MERRIALNNLTPLLGGGGVFTCGVPVFCLSLTFPNVSFLSLIFLPASQSSFTNDTALSFRFLLSILVSIYDLRSVYLKQALGSGWPEASVRSGSVCSQYVYINPKFSQE